MALEGYAAGLIAYAKGAVTIDTSQAEQAPAKMQAVAQGVNRAMAQVGSGADKADKGLGQVTRAINSITSAFGVSFGIQGAVQLGKMAIAAAETATAYNRQAVAARNLAGSQDQLNAKLAAYDKATGGIVDKTTELANVTKLMSVGFADTVPELEKFATVIRGISVAMGQPQDLVTQNLILELFTQRGARLDQLGLEYEKVKKRAKELEAADTSLTAKQAYQNAVLEQAEERFGKLATSGAGAATGLEKAGTSASNLGLTIGQILGPTINAIGADFSRTLDRWQAGLQAAIDLTKDLAVAVHLVAPDVSATLGRRTGIGSNIRQAPKSLERTPLEGERQIHLDWAKGVEDLNDQVHTDIIDEETSFGQQRAKTVADYNKSVARDEQAFARTRLRENMDYLEAVAGVAKDATRREQGAAADLARTQAQAQIDSEEKIAGLREDANKRLAELDADYEKARLKRAKDLSDKLLDAAGNLDARQVYELQRDAAKQEEEAKSAHDDARDKIGEQLDERIDDERKSLAKSSKLRQEAYDRQIEAGRENDRLKLADMKDAFAKSQAREAEDHAIQVSQRAEDQAAQLTEMDTQHGLRLNQIRQHALEERIALGAAADAAAVAAHVADAATKKRVDDKEKHLEDLWDKFHKHIEDSLTPGAPRTLAGGPVRAYASGGYVPQNGLAYLHAGEYVMPRARVTAGMGGGHSSRTINVQPGAIVINEARRPGDTRAEVEAALLDILEAA